MEDKLGELLRAARDQQPGAWPRLGGPLMLKLRLSLTKWVGAEDAKDLAQRTFIILMDRLPGFQPEGTLEAWVFGIARHLALDELRARKRRIIWEAAAGEVQLRQSVSPSSQLRRNECFKVLQDELAHLPKHLRDVIEHDLAGGDAEAFARKEGIALATVRTRRHRAHELLSERIRQRSKTPLPEEKPTPPAI
jgi:RNA polymerase sigma-70 factor, ECF subfamily